MKMTKIIYQFLFKDNLEVSLNQFLFKDNLEVSLNQYSSK